MSRSRGSRSTQVTTHGPEGEGVNVSPVPEVTVETDLGRPTGFPTIVRPSKTPLLWVALLFIFTD